MPHFAIFQWLLDFVCYWINQSINHAKDCMPEFSNSLHASFSSIKISFARASFGDPPSCVNWEKNASISVDDFFKEKKRKQKTEKNPQTLSGWTTSTALLYTFFTWSALMSYVRRKPGKNFGIFIVSKWQNASEKNMFRRTSCIPAPFHDVPSQRTLDMLLSKARIFRFFPSVHSRTFVEKQNHTITNSQSINQSIDRYYNRTKQTTNQSIDRPILQ